MSRRSVVGRFRRSTKAERDLEKGLRELNPGIHFDPGGRHGIPHPMQNIRQGVYYNGKNVIAIERGMVPEYERIDYKTGMVIVNGWCFLFEVLLRKKIPGLARENLCAKFGVPVKKPEENFHFKVVCKETRVSPGNRQLRGWFGNNNCGASCHPSHIRPRLANCLLHYWSGSIVHHTSMGTAAKKVSHHDSRVTQ